MTKKYTLVCNWKMEKILNDELRFATSNLDKLINLTNSSPVNIVICPSFISIYPLKNIFNGTKIEIGEQNCSNHLRGGFTGQISAQSLNEVECKYCIIGHSERRTYNKETDAEINQKFLHLIDFNINPILCIGENLEDTKSGQTLQILLSQLEKVINSIKTLTNGAQLTLYISYEPIWSIGSGLIPDIKHLELVFAWLKNKLQNNINNFNFKLLYGGSVNEENVLILKRINDIDGFILGKSSLEFDSLKKIISQLKD